MTVFAVLAFLVDGYEEFIKDKSMLKQLYGELPPPKDGETPSDEADEADERGKDSKAAFK